MKKPIGKAAEDLRSFIEANRDAKDDETVSEALRLAAGTLNADIRSDVTSTKAILDFAFATGGFLSLVALSKDDDVLLAEVAKNPAMMEEVRRAARDWKAPVSVALREVLSRIDDPDVDPKKSKAPKGL